MSKINSLLILLLVFALPLTAMITSNGTMTDLISNDKPLTSGGIIAAHPDRIELIAREFLQDVELHTDFRGYKIYTGNYKGKRFFAAYSAMGGPTVSMLVENLIVAGAKKIIRIGTSDNNNDFQDLSYLSIVTEMMGLDGMMIDYGYERDEIGEPIHASKKLVDSLVSASSNVKTVLAKGYNIDAYHVYSNPDRFAKNPEVIRQRMEYFKSQGATIRDMESGTLFMIARLRGIEAATILIPKIKHQKESKEQKQTSDLRQNEAITIALEALSSE